MSLHIYPLLPNTLYWLHKRSSDKFDIAEDLLQPDHTVRRTWWRVCLYHRDTSIAYRLRMDRRSEEPEQEKAAAESCTSTEGADGRRQLCTRDMWVALTICLHRCYRVGCQSELGMNWCLANMNWDHFLLVCITCDNQGSWDWQSFISCVLEPVHVWSLYI